MTGAGIFQRQAEGDAENEEKHLQALRATEISSSHRAPIALNPYGHITQHVKIRRVDKVGNVNHNTAVEAHPSVSPFFTDNPEECLGRPGPSVSWPPSPSPFPPFAGLRGRGE
jgi:hypothetical protein